MRLFGADESAPKKLNPERRIWLDRLENILREVNMERSYQLLTPRERKIISLYYLEGYKDEEIAKLYTLTQQAINYIRNKGINKLKIF